MRLPNYFYNSNSWLFVDSQLSQSERQSVFDRHDLSLQRHRALRLPLLSEEFPKAKTAEQLEALLPCNAKAMLDAAAAQTEAELAA